MATEAMSQSAAQNHAKGPISPGQQQTISREVSLAGIGLHSGQTSQITLRPALENTGLVIVQGNQRLAATADHVQSTVRGTRLLNLATPEHLLAALFGLGIDNLEIIVKGSEVPILDGSALPFVEALLSAKIVSQSALKNPLKLNFPCQTAEKEARLEAWPGNGFKVNFMIDFPKVGQQKFSFSLDHDSFIKEIAPARTVGYLAEHGALKKQGLALGASLENALVIGVNGYLNRPRFEDEIVRHKILDLMGDLALLGRPLEAEILANKTGHRHNIELVRRILENDRA
ncbi:UDP-3-O-[3-hydroxymyristoyl] N-acetylglucosamine deacetylase [Candidatus Saganbacteria bacterium CG08_land_8_20_14_0_20_45_16]|uniref:UDP-3-O-acyl-N-acetylglucosamine deacetylase n=1 Tax=Candidatus Saganbacteria bacterium CG08_land_8_20_14_0_20_45_16 TaxID=2014293 RepID=A0A2H0Y3T9_UNCSA|nr:MAG: UDP-3-O-[3-hydroxymyristoyl] N-acetylglucosamine deacetylase [Candidatus Saganbacteria bacterium CG08_land_8_20_14_0_20_45_16]